MSLLSRCLLLLAMTAVSPWPLPADTTFSEQQDKEKPKEQSSLQPRQTPGAPDVQPVPPKLSTEPKPQPPSGLPVKTDASHDRDLEAKEPLKKPVGSLILTVKLALLADSRLFRYEIEEGPLVYRGSYRGRDVSIYNDTVIAFGARGEELFRTQIEEPLHVREPIHANSI